MAAAALTRTALPGEPELQRFAHMAAHLLVERQARAPGARAVARQVGVGLQHLDHRDYQPGDEVRHIDWRQTARRLKPVLRRFEAESAGDWTLLLDASSSMALPGPAPKWQRAVTLAAALAFALLQLGHRVGLLAYGTRVLAECPRGRGQHQYAAIARRLGALRPAPAGEASDLAACANHLRGAASVFVLSDFLADDEMRRDLLALRQRCTVLHALQLSDAADTDLGAVGDVDLVDVETGARLPWHASDGARARAAAERATMTHRLRSFCTRSGMVFSDWDGVQPWQHALLGHLVHARNPG